MFFQKCFEASAHLFMTQYGATLDRREAFFNFTDKPGFVVHETLYRFPCESFRITAPLRGQAREFGLQLGREI